MNADAEFQQLGINNSQRAAHVRWVPVYDRNLMQLISVHGNGRRVGKTTLKCIH